MNKVAAVVLAGLLVLAGCGGSDSTNPPDADVVGLWVVVADAGDPPETFACGGAHSGMGGTLLCGSFDLDLTQNGAAFSGASTQAYCGFDWAVTGMVSGTLIVGQVVATDGMTTQRFPFEGVVNANSGLLEPLRFSVDGLAGDCDVLGFYRIHR